MKPLRCCRPTILAGASASSFASCENVQPRSCAHRLREPQATITVGIKPLPSASQSMLQIAAAQQPQHPKRQGAAGEDEHACCTRRNGKNSTWPAQRWSAPSLLYSPPAACTAGQQRRPTRPENRLHLVCACLAAPVNGQTQLR